MIWHAPRRDYDTDPELAEFNRSNRVKAPPERVLETDWPATFRLGEDRGASRVVRLACGHARVTSSRAGSLRCLECQSIIDNGGDYVAIRRFGYAFTPEDLETLERERLDEEAAEGPKTGM